VVRFLLAPRPLRRRRPTNFIENQIRPQLKQAEQQLDQARFGRDFALNQTRINGTPRLVVLAIAFALVALVALL